MAIKWTQEMDNFLNTNYPLMNKKKIAKKLGVSVQALIKRVNFLEIKKRYGVKIGGKYFTYEKAVEILESCKKISPRRIAKEIGINASALVMFVRRKSLLNIKEHEKRLREKREKRSKEKLHKEKEKKRIQLMEKALSVRPSSCRLREGMFYWVPFEHKQGAYKIKETGSPFDERMFERGWYFATEKDASTFSFLTQRRHSCELPSDTDLENL